MDRSYTEVRLEIESPLGEAAELALIELGAAGTSQPVPAEPGADWIAHSARDTAHC